MVADFLVFEQAGQAREALQAGQVIIVVLTGEHRSFGVVEGLGRIAISRVGFGGSLHKADRQAASWRRTTRAISLPAARWVTRRSYSVCKFSQISGETSK